MVGKFAHTLRMRLQLEHLGVNTDDFERQTMMMEGLARERTTSRDQTKFKSTPTHSFNHDNSPLDGEHFFKNETSSSDDENEGATYKHKSWYLQALRPKNTGKPSSGKRRRTKIGKRSGDTSAKPLAAGATATDMQGQTPRIDSTEELEGEKRDPNANRKKYTSTSSVEALKEERSDLSSLKPRGRHDNNGSTFPQVPRISHVTSRPIPVVDPLNVVDPLDELYFWDQWNAVAQHNTEVYRRVFRPMPDNEVKTWSEYKEVFAFGERLAKAENPAKDKVRTEAKHPRASGPLGALGNVKVLTEAKGGPESRDHTKESGKQEEMERIKRDPWETKDKLDHEMSESLNELCKEKSKVNGEAKQAGVEIKDGMHEANEALEHPASPNMNQRRRTRSNASRAGQFTVLPRNAMEELLSEIQGHLVEWPMEWLAKEDANGNFLYNIDKYDQYIVANVLECNLWKFLIKMMNITEIKAEISLIARG